MKTQIVIGQKVSRALRERSKELKQNMTPAETALWERLRANRCNGLHFRRQQVIGRYIADFYCHRLGLVIELDGAVHDGRIEVDAVRDKELSERNLKVIRFRNEEVVGNLDEVLNRIAEECK